MSEEKPKLEVVGADSESEPQVEQSADDQNAEQVAQIVSFWTERARVASEVAHQLIGDDSVASFCVPSPGDILQAMSLYELPGRLVGSYFGTQQELMKQMQGRIAQAKMVPQGPQLQKGPRRKRR